MTIYGCYSWLYPNAFLLRALGYYSLELGRQVYLGKHVYKLLVSLVNNPQILVELRLIFLANNVCIYNICMKSIICYIPMLHVPI